MKIHKGNFFIYLIIVVIPVLLLGIYYFNAILKENEDERKKDALWVASIYQKNWDQFITETMTCLKILSFSASENLDSPEKMKPLLNQANQNDPRYGGLYLLNQKGKILTGTATLRNDTDFSKLPFVQDVINTKDTLISSEEEILKNNQQIIGLGSPVLDENNHLQSIIVADLRIDYMRNLMKVLTPQTKLCVVNGEDHMILYLNVVRSDLRDNTQWVTSPMERLPWSIKVKIPEKNWQEILKSFGKTILIIIIIQHVLFLLIKYILLWMQSRKERQQSEVQKLELVGTMAASTAHEIRNPLTGVKGLIQLLGEKYTDPEDNYYFEVIDSELTRINEIVSELLILGKPTTQLTNLVNMTEVLNGMKPLIISEGNSHNAECVWLLPVEPLMVQCAKDQIKQVILNIAKNSFESLERPGTIKIKLYTLMDECRLEISDNGKGIPDEELEKIFLPFYTSKETGTGLGLVICKRIISSFGGTIQIESKESLGTLVKISLPLSKTKRDL